ncbi:calcyphosin-like protein [Pomacea canaliculata]|uniref:calcyphosin-like protein n=1 Tax=Pomacea canaliculata TaxID=400727 RepID=UPI000D72CF2D|nr:calcyphosin-like protein [Pomacea canaliculata]XP_025110756.1 calcyphosin-like protein [Pomacea canaliculata]
MDCPTHDRMLAQKCAQQLATERDPIERFKLMALKHGCSGIKSIGTKFRLMDTSGDRKLTFDEFVEGCQRVVARMSKEELKTVFDAFDKDGNGYMNYDEFLAAVRPGMSEARKRLVMDVFIRLDKTGDGVITVDDILDSYNVRSHPKYQNGEMSKKEILTQFLTNFEVGDHVDGTVTRKEWEDYYAGISHSIDDDSYFRLMMNNSWNPPPPFPRK